MKGKFILYVTHSLLPKGATATTDVVKTTFHANGTSKDFPVSYDAFQDLLLVGNNGKAIQCTIYKVPIGYLTPYSIYHELKIVMPQNDDMFQVRPILFFKAGHSKLLTPFGEILGSSDFMLTHRPNMSRKISLTVEMGEHISLSKNNRPCLTDKKMKTALEANETLADMTSCFNRYMTGLVPCYNNGLGGKCSKEDQEIIRKKVQSLYDGGEKEYLKTMSCQIPCRIPTYKVTEQSTFEWIEKGNDDSSVELVFYAPKPAYTVTEEFLMYDLGDLAGDVGGMVGMLLGASIFGFYQSLQNLLLKYALTDERA